MKLATERGGGRDGRLIVVSRDLTRTVTAQGIAPSLRHALEQWEECEPKLVALYERLNAGAVDQTQSYAANTLLAPLPRAWQWLDASAFPSHGELMQRAFNLPPIETQLPLMYQGMSHRFLGGTRRRTAAVGGGRNRLRGRVRRDHGIPCRWASARKRRIVVYVRLAVQINDWSLRAIAPVEMKTGFGWVQAKPACSVAPVAVTLDELGPDWTDGRITASLRIVINGVHFGEVPATDMQFGFHELVAHAARTRDLCEGTVIGSGTISCRRSRETGSCCIAERRAIEMIDEGAARTDYLRFGDRVRMSTRLSNRSESPFGDIDQCVVRRRGLGL
jgi:fumarylacetoacetate (FAA) hydrolase